MANRAILLRVTIHVDGIIDRLAESVQCVEIQNTGGCYRTVAAGTRIVSEV